MPNESNKAFTSWVWWMEQLSRMRIECLAGKGCMLGINRPQMKSMNLSELTEPVVASYSNTPSDVIAAMTDILVPLEMMR